MMSPEHLGRLVDEQAAALVLYARQWSAAPEDIVQEAFLKLVAQKTPPHNPVPWLYRVVRNEAISTLRKDKRRRQHESRVGAQNRAWFVPTREGPIDVEAATLALQSLPSDQRETIVAHLWGGLTFEQIAQVMATSSSSAHRCYVAALENLRERLGVACPKKSLSPT
jgi:RNA polymerase sigma-70 factor (ECF subfamily)